MKLSVPLQCLSRERHFLQLNASLYGKKGERKQGKWLETINFDAGGLTFFPIIFWKKKEWPRNARSLSRSVPLSFSQWLSVSYTAHKKMYERVVMVLSWHWMHRRSAVECITLHLFADHTDDAMMREMGNLGPTFLWYLAFCPSLHCWISKSVM